MLAAVLTCSYMGVELVAGVLTGSLALLADAGHMLSDFGSLALALFAVWLAERPATPDKSFGYKRAEILAALANGVTLVAIGIWILIEAYDRIREPPDVTGGWMLAVALLGLVVNLASTTILHRARGASLNVEAAYRHVIADVLGSIGVIVAAVVIIVTGWAYADPVVGAAIGTLILLGSWSILRDSIRILLEATPAGIDANEVGRSLRAHAGIVDVHDLHIWTITSGFPALSAHVLVAPGDDCHARRRELERILARDFGIDHTTLQVDHASGEQLHSIQRKR